MFSAKDLRRLLIPLIMEQLLAVLIGSMDTVMVSSCGQAAVSGVSLVDSINVLLINVFSCLATGGAVVASQYLGMKKPGEASKAAKQLYYVVLFASCFLMSICIIFRDGILQLVFGKVEADVMQSARSYFLITALSYPFLAVYNASAALLRSQGNSRDSLITSIVMNVVNVCGNAITIYGLGMGVTGAAVATLIGRIAGVVVIEQMVKRPTNSIKHPNLFAFEYNGKMVSSILRIGIPNGIEGGIFQAGKLLLLSLVSTFGTVSIAANAVGNTVCSYQVIVGNAVSLAIITVIGQCVGAGDYEQARYYARKLMKFAYIAMGIVNLIIIALNPWIADPFNLTPEAARLTRVLVFTHGFFSILMWPTSFCLPNVLRAAGDTVFTMAVSALSMATFRIISGYVLASVFGLGVLGVWFAMIIDWVCRCICFVIRYRGHKWETRKVVS